MKKILILPILLIVFGCIYLTNAQRITPAMQKLLMAQNYIENFYVDSVDGNKLAEDAIKGMLQELDPHSSYTTPEETRELTEPLEGNFSGIGISYNINKDTIYVISTVSGGPSERLGLRAGDRIIAINDSNVAGIKIKTRDVQKKLRGQKGTTVDVRVLRHNPGHKSDSIDFRITRDNIPIYSVDAAYMVEPGIGYIRISRFAAETDKEMREAIKKLKKSGMKSLILDLTDNGGGYLNAAQQVLGELLEPGSMAVYTQGTNSPLNILHSWPADNEPLFGNGRLVVMVNQYSASASEITSGAIQDYDRGVIVGRRTYGKGLVQRPIPFNDGSMIRLTVAHYYTPTGRDIQKPYTKGNANDYQHDIIDRFNRGELMHQDSIKYIDSLKVSTLKSGRTIYGGGGISPDKFVPLDTTEFSKYYRSLVAKGVLNAYAIQYVDKNRKAIKKQFKDDDLFVAGFDVTPEMLQVLYDMGSKEGVEFNAEEAEISTPLFKMILKGLIGRDIYDNATYFKIYNLHDPIFKKSLEIIKGNEYDELLKAPEES